MTTERIAQINDICLPVFSPPVQLALVSPNGGQYDSLLRQLRDRMEEGCGETIYVVGVGSGKDTWSRRHALPAMPAVPLHHHQ